MANSADPGKLASSEANWSGSTLFAKTGHAVFSKRRVKNKIHNGTPCCCDWHFKGQYKSRNQKRKTEYKTMSFISTNHQAM